MNASSSPSATMATIMAFTTNEAETSLQSFSKMDAIAQSETRIGPVLRPLLIPCVSRHVLPGAQLKPQSAAVRLRRKPSDLINLCEIFRTRGEEYISEQPSVTPVRQRKSQPSNSGRPPFRPRS